MTKIWGRYKLKKDAQAELDNLKGRLPMLTDSASEVYPISKETEKSGLKYGFYLEVIELHEKDPVRSNQNLSIKD